MSLAVDVSFCMECGKMRSALRLFSDEERSIQMGKDLRGKELGAGLYQRLKGAKWVWNCVNKGESGMTTKNIMFFLTFS